MPAEVGLFSFFKGRVILFFFFFLEGGEEVFVLALRGRGERCCTARVSRGRVRGCLLQHSNDSWVRRRPEGRGGLEPRQWQQEGSRGAYPGGRAGGRCPAAGEGGRAPGRREEGERGGRARAHLSWTAARAELRLTEALLPEEGGGRAGRRGRDAEGRRRRRLGRLARLSLVLPPAG